MYEYQYSASKIYKLFIISSLLYFYNVLLYQLFNRRHVGMADEADSKSVGGNTVWVQVPLPAVGAELKVLRFLFPFLYSNPISCFFHFIANHLLWINCYKIVTIHLCLANTDVTGHHATGKGGRKYVFQIH